MLVLADNLLLLFLGWEGVGLCSYLLIGFWYQDPANGRAARKAFIVTRVGDTAMTVGLFLLSTISARCDIQDLMRAAQHTLAGGLRLAVAAAALLLGGAVGKSAQLPLQTWLPDAMAGPTPASALIHAATMVTAGVYLIARTTCCSLWRPGSARGGRHRRCHPADGRLQCAGADRHQARAGLFHHQPDRLHVPGAGRGSVVRRDLPPHDPRLFQGSALPGGGHRHWPCITSTTSFKMGGLRKELPLDFWTFLIGGCRPGRLSAGYRGLLQQGPDSVERRRFRLRRGRFLGGWGCRCRTDFSIYVPALYSSFSSDRFRLRSVKRPGAAMVIPSCCTGGTGHRRRIR